MNRPEYKMVKYFFLSVVFPILKIFDYNIPSRDATRTKEKKNDVYTRDFKKMDKMRT